MTSGNPAQGQGALAGDAVQPSGVGRVDRPAGLTVEHERAPDGAHVKARLGRTDNSDPAAIAYVNPAPQTAPQTSHPPGDQAAPAGEPYNSPRIGVYQASG